MSARVSVSASTSAGGASRLAKMDTGRTAALPGVYTANSALSRIRRMRSPSWSQSASPWRHWSAVRAASSSTLSPFCSAAAGSIQGRKSAGARSGKVSSRLPMSPLGSMTMAGSRSMAASSSSAMPRPVLPLPVMPMMAACVVSCLLLMRSGWRVASPVSGSTSRPR